MVFDMLPSRKTRLASGTSVPNFGWRWRADAVDVGALPKPCKNRNPEIILFTSFARAGNAAVKCEMRNKVSNEGRPALE
jgi:hypothetical protein